MGWQEEERGLAWIVEGAAQHLPRVNTVCLKSRCGMPYPITWVGTPVPEGE
jgi:hypothetical protein